MEIKTKKKLSVYVVFAIIFGAIGVICFICNIIGFITTTTYYVAQGYTFGEIFFSSLYQLVQPLEMFGGVSLILFALNTIIKKLSGSNDTNIIKPIAVVDVSAEPAETQEL